MTRQELKKLPEIARLDQFGSELVSLINRHMDAGLTYSLVSYVLAEYADEYQGYALRQHAREHANA